MTHSRGTRVSESISPLRQHLTPTLWRYLRRPGSRAVEKVDAANQRTLTRAASADNAEDITGFDVDVYILTGKEFSFAVSSIVFLRYVF